MKEDYFTMSALGSAIERYNRYESSKGKIRLDTSERNELLTKINSINRELEEQEITFKKVKEQGIYTDEITTEEGFGRFKWRLPMDFIKENYVYCPPFKKKTLIVGVEVIIPVGAVMPFTRGVLCYFKYWGKDKEKELWFGKIQDNWWASTIDNNLGMYVLELNNVNKCLINWNQLLWGDLK